MPLLGGRIPPELRSRPTVAVLGMHRSGTSVVAGMLQDHGVELGEVRERSPYNPRGNRELPELNRLHDGVLERSGGTWWEPPSEVILRGGDFRRRNRILRSIPGPTIGVKDPRMLVALELWRDLNLKPVGVIRNPVAVSDSLQRRGRGREDRYPQLSLVRWEALWRHYNRSLLDELERRPFPLIQFDRAEQLGEQVRDALSFHGLPSGASGFFDPDLVGAPLDDWRARVASSETLALWDSLAELALVA